MQHPPRRAGALVLHLTPGAGQRKVHPARVKFKGRHLRGGDEYRAFLRRLRIGTRARR
jgi:hypothetical protein